MRHAKTTRIKDAYPNGYTGDGIFSDLQSFDVPWKKENIATKLDILYYSMNDDKPTSKLINRRLTEGEPLNALNREVVAATLCIAYLKQWRKLYNLLTVQYNPIENYRMTETETSNNSVKTTNSEMNNYSSSVTTEDTLKRTGTDTTTETGTDTTLRTGTDDTEESGSITTKRTGTDNTSETGNVITERTGTLGTTGNNEVENSVYGFNSSNAVGSDGSMGTTTDTETRNLLDEENRDTDTTQTLNLTDETTKDINTIRTLNLSDAETKNLTTTQTLNLTDTTTNDVITSGTNDSSGTINESGENERNLTRSGNIGVTTSQQMIQSEIELWKWNYFNQVFSDINKIIALDTY